MLVANSFDLWQKDTFFSAAEEVQQSADIMESAYRKWLRARRELSIPQDLDEIGRELQTALGTAKWQLEEFERAVSQSYRNNGDDITVTRHRQFVSAIQDQISSVETALKEALKVDGKKPFRWVNLDEEECDDLAHFLSGASQTIKDEKSSTGSSLCQSNTNEDCGFVSDVSSRTQMSHPVLEIVIDSNNTQMNASIEVTPKEKGSKPFFWRLRSGNCHGGQRNTQMKMINWINQRLRGGHGSQAQHVSVVMPVKSIRFVLAFMLTIFLVVPFLLHHST